MDFASTTSYLTSVPADWFIIGVFALLMIVDALRVGAGRIGAFAIAFLIAPFVVTALGHALFVGGLIANLSTPVLQAIVFGVVFVALFLLLRRTFNDYGETGGQPLQAVFAGIAVTALVLLAWIQIPVLEAVWHFGGQVQAAFAEPYRFWWLIVSLAALAFAKT